MAGIAQAALSRAETGRTLPQLRTLITLGEVLGQPIGIQLDGQLITSEGAVSPWLEQSMSVV